LTGCDCEQIGSLITRVKALKPVVVGNDCTDGVIGSALMTGAVNSVADSRHAVGVVKKLSSAPDVLNVGLR